MICNSLLDIKFISEWVLCLDFSPAISTSFLTLLTFPLHLYLSQYRHMLTLVGPNSTVHFTSLSKASLESLRKELSSSTSTSNHQSANFELHTSSITTLIKERNWKLDRICLLDPRAEKGLNVRDAGLNRKEVGEKKDGENFFTHFLFGGILGDDPPRDRTSSLRQLGFPGVSFERVPCSFLFSLFREDIWKTHLVLTLSLFISFLSILILHSTLI